MPTALLIANIGNSDIGKDKNPLFSSRNGQINIYDRSRELWGSKEFGSIELLLLDSVLRKIREMFDIGQVYLFYTEQSPPHRQDTKFIAHIVKSILCSRYNFDETSINLRAISKNPADYDEMLKLYRAGVDNIPESADRVFVSLAGGTPQQNFSAMLESVARFGAKATMIYAPRGSEDAVEYGVGYEIYKRMITHQVDILQEKKMYGVAAELAEEYGILDTNEIKMLQAKNHRLLFDFESSQTLYNGVKDKLPEHLEDIHSAIDELEKLKNKDRYALIRELCKNMLVKLEQGAYVDFLGRLFRFEEAVLRFVVENEFNISTEKDENDLRFKSDVSSNNDLKNFLDKNGIDYGTPNRLCLFMMLRFLISKNPDRNDLKIITDTIKKIKKLSDLRNASIMAHGFEGISRDRVNALYNSDELIIDLKKIIDIFKFYR